MWFNAFCCLYYFYRNTCVTSHESSNGECFFWFGMVKILTVDSRSRFTNVFKDMWSSQRIIYWPISLRNHKYTSIEKYHCFLNKLQEISNQDRGSHDVFIKNTKTSQYACNSTPVDGTYIIISVPAVGHEFHFPLEIKLLWTATTLNQGNSGLYEYLWHMLNNSQFAT